MASPTVRPGNGTADSVAELSCWKLVSEFGCTTLVTVATLDSGTSAPDLGADLIAREPVLVQAEFARHLRDDLIAPPVQVEQIDVIAAEQRGERVADIGHGDAEPVGLVVVDMELDLRRLEAEVGVGEDEHAAFARRLLDVGQHVGEFAEVVRGGDDELHRRPAGRARQRRRREGRAPAPSPCLRSAATALAARAFWLRSRSPHGLSRMPAKPWCTSPMPLMVKTCSFSGTVL